MTCLSWKSRAELHLEVPFPNSSLNVFSILKSEWRRQGRKEKEGKEVSQRGAR